MILLYSLACFICAFCLETQLIPQTGTPPIPLKGACLVYNSSETLYVFGGHEKSDKMHNDIFIFYLKESVWKESIPIERTLPTARYNSGCFIHNEFFFVYGGYTNYGPVNDLWRYNTIFLNWQKLDLSFRPGFRHLFGSGQFYYNEKPYFGIFGGWKDLGISSGLYLFDIEDLQWIKLKNAPIELVGTSMIYLNQSLYILGGINAEKQLNHLIFQYELDLKIWTSFPCENWIPRSKFAAGVINETIFAMIGWNDQNNTNVKQIQSLDLKPNCSCKTITTVNQSELLISNYGFSSSPKQFFTFGGFSTTGVTNLLISYDPLSNNLQPLSLKYLSPRNLMNASLVKIGRNLYLFGGMSENVRFNDLWKFDTESSTWTKLRSYGDIPSPRSHHSAVSDGDIMILFGGKDDVKYFNDAYQFNSLTSTWTLLKYKTLNPSARFNSCIVSRLPLFYIYGGETLSGFSGTLIRYNLSDFSYSRVSDSHGFVLGSAQTCTLNNNGDEFQVVYGTSDGDEPLGYVQSYNFTSDSWKTLFQPENESTSRARALITRVADNYYIVGGSTWATTVQKEVFKLSPIKKTVTFIETIDRVVYQAPFTHYKSKIFVYGGGSAYNELIRYGVAIRDFFSIDLLDLCEDDCELVCSSGTFFNNQTLQCEVCPPGYYSSFTGLDHCKACGRGTFNSKFGATTQRQCYPCNQGQYNSHAGASFCLDCLIGFYCPIGSAEPIFYLQDNLITSKQPNTFERKTEEAAHVVRIIQIVLGCIGIFSVGCLVSIDQSRKLIHVLDFFDTNHNHEYEVPLVQRKTMCGGIFSLVLILVSLILIISPIILYDLDNLIETKSLIPFVVLKEITSSITGNLKIKVKFGNYGGKCIDYNENQTPACSSSIFYSVSGVNYKKSTLFCTSEGLDCYLELTLEEADIESVSLIYFSLQEKFSYTSEISVEVISDSSVPDQESSVKMVVFPESNKIFRGETPTVFTFSLTPSYYSNQQDRITGTGFHISPLMNPSGGTAYEPNTLGFTADLHLEINFQRAINGLKTERTLQFTLSILVLTLIGSLSGIKGIVGFFMKITEKKYIQRDAAFNRKLKLSRLRYLRIINQDFFQDVFEQSESDLLNRSKLQKSSFLNTYV